MLLLVALALGVLTGNLTLKPLIARPRPCWVDESVRLLIPKPTDYSFPSGHTLSSVIGATVLTKANAKFGLAAIPLAALIAFSRLYLYVHFLGAAVLGVAIGLLVCAAGGRVITALTERASPPASAADAPKPRSTQNIETTPFFLRVIQNFILCILPGIILRYIIAAVDR